MDNEDKLNEAKMESPQSTAEQGCPSSVDLQSTDPQGEAERVLCHSEQSEESPASKEGDPSVASLPQDDGVKAEESASIGGRQDCPPLSPEGKVNKEASQPSPEGKVNKEASQPSPQGKGDRRTAVEEVQEPAEESPEGNAAEAVKLTPGKKALNIVVNVVVTIVLIFVVFMTVSIILSAGKDYTNFFGYTYLGVETDSMDGGREDSFAVGDLVIVKILDEDERMEMQVGDIATFYETTSDGTRIINSHRIISIESLMDGIQYYRTQGDNEEEADNFVLSSSMIIGKVTGHVGGIGYVVTWVSSQTGFFVCVVLPSFALVIYCIVNLIMTVRSRNKETEAEKEDAMRQKILAEMESSQSAEAAKEEAMRQKILAEMEAEKAAKAAAEAAAKTEAEKEAEMRKKILAEMGLNEDGSKKE